MADTANVINLTSYRETAAPGVRSVLISPRVRVGSESSEKAVRETRMDDLYPEVSGSDALVQRVRILLRDAAGHAANAKEALVNGDALEADQQTMLLSGILPELFCCREVSEGMAAFVLGLFHALNNKRGAPLNLDQIYPISKFLNKISEGPFISFPEAVEVLANLQDEGLDIAPPEATSLSHLLVGENE
jgi:hypothetical protein